MRNFCLTLIACVCASLASAQTYPDYKSTDLNDLAGLIVDAAARDTLKTQLNNLRTRHGIEMTVVTLPSQAPYAPDMSMEAFATGLFNHWGIGDATRNDGIMVLVLPEDRAMRIELGAGYGQDWNDVAGRIVDRTFLPVFRDGAYQTGIVKGVDAVIEDIAMPFAAGNPAPEPRDDGLPWYYFVIFGAVLMVAKVRSWIGDVFIRVRRCPQCGRKGTLRASRRTITPATTTQSGRSERRVWCTDCGYEDFTTITLAQHSASSSFGGGRSGGGGASGRW